MNGRKLSCAVVVRGDAHVVVRQYAQMVYHVHASYVRVSHCDNWHAHAQAQAHDITAYACSLALYRICTFSSWSGGL